MDLLNTLVSLLSALAGVPVVGKVLAVVVVVSSVLAGLASAIVALLHALVAFFLALSLLPVVGAKFARVASFFQTEEPKLDDFVNNKLLGILNQLSAIPLPKK